MGPILGERLNWKNIDQYDSYIASLTVIGMAIGSFVGGMIVKSGRRKTMIIWNLIGACGIGVTLIMNFWAIFFGKFIWAIAVGVLSTAGPLMVAETIPADSMGLWGNSTNWFIVTGLFVTNMLGLGLPKPNTPEVYTSNYWRIVYASPLVNISIVVLSFIFAYKQDSL